MPMGVDLAQSTHQERNLGGTQENLGGMRGDFRNYLFTIATAHSINERKQENGQVTRVLSVNGVPHSGRTAVFTTGTSLVVVYGVEYAIRNKAGDA